MPVWLSNSIHTVEIPIETVIIRLLFSWIAGIAVAQIATRSQKRSHDDTLPSTLVLMAVLIAMATQIIGDNVARAFSLVGALSIVRFRTAVATSRDVAFVLASVVVGMSIGAGQLLIAITGIAVLALATLLENLKSIPTAKPSENASSDCKLMITLGIGGHESADPALMELFEKHTLLSASTTRKGASVTYIYSVTLRPTISPKDVIATLNRIPLLESITFET